MNSEPIVTVVLIAYNSEKYILEALNSIYFQTYKKIELVVSDDFSTDSTYELIKKWSINTRDRFIDYKFNRNDKNLGITLNIVKGIELSTGKFIKLLSADDILIKDGIEKLVYYCQTNNFDFTYSKTKAFIDKEILSSKVHYLNEYGNYILSRGLDFNKKISLTGFKVSNHGFFFTKKYYLDNNFYNLDYSMLDDYQLYLKTLSSVDTILPFLDYYTCMYRVRGLENNIDKSSKRFLLHFENLKRFQENYIYPKAKIVYGYFRFRSLVYYHNIQRRLAYKDNYSFILRLLLYINPVYILDKIDFLIWRYLIFKDGNL